MKTSYKKESYVEKELVETLIKLLQNQEMDEISIRDLCHEAGVGRASFYRHYQNKEEILERHAPSLMKQWEKEFESNSNSRPWNVFESLFTHIKNHHSFYKILYKTNRDMVLRTSLRQKIGLATELTNEEAYQKVFFADGICGWIEEWIERDMKESPTELNQLLQHYFTDILSHLGELYIKKT